jgi:hypothetical protein
MQRDSSTPPAVSNGMTPFRIFVLGERSQFRIPKPSFRMRHALVAHGPPTVVLQREVLADSKPSVKIGHSRAKKAP